MNEVIKIKKVQNIKNNKSKVVKKSK